MRTLKMCTSDNSPVENENRLIALVNLINDPEKKLSAVIAILKQARVPWSKAVENVSNEALKLKHPLVGVVRWQLKLKTKELVLKKYGFREDSAHEQNNIWQLSLYINRIFRKGNREMLKDAVALSIPYSEELHTLPYSILFKKYLDESPPRVPDFNSLTKSLNVAQRRAVFHEVAYFCRNKIRRGPCHSDIFEVESAMNRSLYGHATTSESPRDFPRRVVSPVKTSQSLKVLGINYEPRELFVAKPREIVQQFLENIGLSEGNIDEFNENMKKAEKGALLLKYPKELTWCKLALRCCNESKFILLSHLFEQLKDAGEDFFKCHSRIFLELAYSVVMKCSANGKISHQLAEALSSSLVSSVVHGSDTGNMSWKLDLIKICRMFEMNKSYVIINETNPDLNDAESFRLDPDILVPLVARLKNPEFDEQLLQNAIESFYTGDLEVLPMNLSTLKSLFYLTLLTKKLNLMTPVGQKTLGKYFQRFASCVTLRAILSEPSNFDLDLSLFVFNFFTIHTASSWIATMRSSSFFSDKSLSTINNWYRLVLQYFSARSEEMNFIESLLYAILLNEQKRCSWLLKGRCLGVPSNDCRLSSLEDRKKFLSHLVAHPNVNMNILRKYCRDVDLSEELCYIECLKHTLLSWQPKYSLLDVGSNKRLIVENDPRELSTKCRSIASRILLKQEFSDLFLNELLEKVNPFYYEVASVILELRANFFEADVASCLAAINFLMSYTRHSSPSDDEVSDWFMSRPESCFPEIGKFRLSFKGFPYQHTFLEREVCLENYHTWIAAPNMIHHLSRDVICFLAVHNPKNREPKSMTWNSTPHQRDLLEKIMECVSNMSSLKMIVDCLNYTVSTVLAPGVDQIEAAKKCYEKALEWSKREKSSDSSATLQTVKEKYLRLSTIHILNTYKLGNDNYLAYVSSPEKLIHDLYHDCSITESHACSSVGFRGIRSPDVNGAVERIADLHHLNTSKIALELLSKWLKPSTCCNKTLNEAMMNALEQHSDLSDNAKCIVRASYMLRGRELPGVEQFLVMHAFPPEQSIRSNPHTTSFRALKCLMNIKTREELQRITPGKIASIRNYALELEILSGMETFGLTYSISDFERMEKTYLVDKLINLTSSEAILLAIKICFEFNVTSARTWDILINQMIEMKLDSKLHEILRAVDHNKASTEVIRSAWEFLSNSLLSDEREKLSDSKAKQLIDLVYSCPNLTYLNVRLIEQRLRAAGHVDLAETLVNVKCE